MSKVLWFSQTLFLLLFVDCNDINWYRLQSMDNKMTYPNTALETVNCRKIKCAKKCFENLNCMSFFYDINTKMCYLHRYVYDETSPTQISNTTYYVSPLRACPNTYALKSGFCFRIYWTEKNFYDARTVCQADGGDLVIFDSQEKTDTIIQDLIPSKRYVFGMFNIQSDKSFDLVDGRTSADFPFRFWKPNRPDGPFDIPLCGSLNHNSYGYYWTDSDCNFKRTIICEVK